MRPKPASTRLAGSILARRQRLAGPLSAVGALAAGTLLVAVVDPNQPGHYPLCPTKWLTGIDCPGCGGLRATHDLAHGNIASAFSHNALFVILVPLIVFLLGRNIYSAWTGRPSKPFSPRLSRNLMIGLAIATVAFTIVRNLPFWRVPGIVLIGPLDADPPLPTRRECSRVPWLA